MGLKYSIQFISAFFLAGLFLVSCSTTSWEVVDDKAMDINEYQKVDARFYLQSANTITPEQPVIRFDIKSINTYEYTQRVLTERYIQRYRPRLGYVLLGTAGAGLSFYAAYSDQLLNRPTNPQKYALTGAGAILTTLSFMNMKPVGEPTKTGERRLLRETGTAQEMDTTTARPYNLENPFIRISYKGDTLIPKAEWQFIDGQISVNLAEEIDAGIFKENPEDQIVVEAFYDSLSSSREVAVSSIFERFVVVENQITALRNQPENEADNILTELGEGSQLKLVSKEGSWYKVLYGISETWIAANDVRVIWRPSEFSSDLSVIAIPNVPFGTVDVERNIPVLGRSRLNQAAFILSNNSYKGEYSERIYGERDAKLIEEYLVQGFGVRPANIFKAMNISSDQILERAYTRMAGAVQNEERTLFVYINGYAEIRSQQVYLIGTDPKEGAPNIIDLHKFFRALNNLDMEKLVILADLDFNNSGANVTALQDLASIVTDQNPNVSVIFSSRPDQQSGIYSSSNGSQNRHSLFTYFLADAWKQKKLNMSEILNYLERNVPFTSRSLYDRPQDPLLFGNRDLELTD